MRSAFYFDPRDELMRRSRSSSAFFRAPAIVSRSADRRHDAMTRNRIATLFTAHACPTARTRAAINCLRNLAYVLVSPLGISASAFQPAIGKKWPAHRSANRVAAYAVQVRNDRARPPCQRAIIPRDGRRWILVGQCALEISIGVPHRDRTNAA
jgi:hypothetical protein